MALPPLKSSISAAYPNPDSATARAGFAALYDFVTSFPFGQCRLVKSGANLLLTRYNGLWLTINDKVQAIPSAGVSLAATGLTPGTLYYIYAYMSGATLTLEASTTGHSTDTNTGVEIKTGDATRTLVGMARPITGPAWQDTDTQRFVASWFNRRGVRLTGAFTTTRTTTSGTFAEVNTEIRNEFLCWAFDPLQVAIMGSASSSTAAAFCQTLIGIDGSATDSLSSNRQAAAGGIDYPVASSLFANLAEGYHYATLMGKVTAGTGTWYGGSGGDRCVVTSLVQI